MTFNNTTNINLFLNLVILGKDGVTAIGLACLQGDLDIVKMLLERQEIDINCQTIDGSHPSQSQFLKVMKKSLKSF